MKQLSTLKIILTALFAALICVATMLVQIPIPATGGYANLGDGVILICAFLMHPPLAVLAAGIGSMLADLLAGYIAYIPGTLVIKAGVALIAALIYRRFGADRSPRHCRIAMIAAGVAAEAFMVIAYFAYEAAILGFGAGAAAGVIGNCGQGAVAVLAAGLVSPALLRSDEIRELMHKTRP